MYGKIKLERVCCLCGSVIDEKNGVSTDKPEYCDVCTVLVIENDNNMTGGVDDFLDTFKRRHQRELQFI